MIMVQVAGKIGSVGVVLVVLAGCSGANTFATRTPRSNVELVEQVVRDPGLDGAIEIASARIDERGGMSFAQVTVVNRSASTRSIQYRFDWFDGDGVNVTPLGEAFRAVTLGPGESRDLQNSAASRGVDFRFTIRSAGR